MSSVAADLFNLLGVPSGTAKEATPFSPQPAGPLSFEQVAANLAVAQVPEGVLFANSEQAAASPAPSNAPLGETTDQGAESESALFAFPSRASESLLSELGIGLGREGSVQIVSHETLSDILPTSKRPTDSLVQSDGTNANPVVGILSAQTQVALGPSDDLELSAIGQPPGAFEHPRYRLGESSEFDAVHDGVNGNENGLAESVYGTSPTLAVVTGTGARHFHATPRADDLGRTYTLDSLAAPAGRTSAAHQSVLVQTQTIGYAMPAPVDQGPNSTRVAAADLQTVTDTDAAVAMGEPASVDERPYSGAVSVPAEQPLPDEMLKRRRI